MAVAPRGRLWATWYAGVTPAEDKNNYVVLSTSVDGGRFWSPPRRIEVESPRWWVTSAPVRELKDGALILGLYTDTGQGTAWGATIKSYDGGQTWRDLAEIGARARVLAP